MKLFKYGKNHFLKETFLNIEKSHQSSNILIFAIFLIFLTGGTKHLTEV